MKEMEFEYSELLDRLSVTADAHEFSLNLNHLSKEIQKINKPRTTEFQTILDFLKDYLKLNITNVEELHTTQYSLMKLQIRTRDDAIVVYRDDYNLKIKCNIQSDECGDYVMETDSEAVNTLYFTHRYYLSHKKSELEKKYEKIETRKNNLEQEILDLDDELEDLADKINDVDILMS